MNYDSETIGFSVPLGFSPADFQDADDIRPIGAVFDIGGHGSSKPYSTAVNAMIHKQMDEVKNKAAAAAAATQHPAEWKRRLCDFLAQKNNDLLDFLSLRVESHSTLGPGEILLRRFGNPQVHPSHPSVRDFVLDASGADIRAEIAEAFENVKGTGDSLADYAAQTHLLYDEYRISGDNVLNAQAHLKAKLDKLDRIQGKLAALFEIDPNMKYAPLMEATESYIRQVFEESKIEENYKALIEAYRRFATLRELVVKSRALLSKESEPLCTVCLQDPVAYAVTPCGHTYCISCSRRQGNHCFMCRGSIKEKVKLYFG